MEENKSTLVAAVLGLEQELIELKSEIAALRIWARYACEEYRKVAGKDLSVIVKEDTNVLNINPKSK